MEKEYELKGLECVNCAMKIEKTVQKENGVISAAVNFIKGTLKVEVEESNELDLDERIKKIVRRLEPEVLVTLRQKEDCHSDCHCHGDHSHQEDEHGHHHEGIGEFLFWRLFLGALLFVVGICLEHFLSVFNEYILISMFIGSFLLLGSDVLLRAGKNIIRGKVFDENFLMGLATLGALAIGEFAEAVGVMLFYQIGELFQGLAVRQAKKSIANLMDIRPDFANIERDGEIIKVSPEAVEIGTIILVKPGEKIPLDGVIIEGNSTLNTTALTGESRPLEVSTGDIVLSGSVNQMKVLKIKVTHLYKDSTVAKIIDLVENASEKKAPTENFITKFAKFYTPIVVISAVLIAAIPPLFIGISDGAIWMNWIKRGLLFLVISCPCALVVSIPLGFFGGIGGASKSGVLIKGGNYLEALNKLEIVVFDKTGTLTKGLFKVTEIIPYKDVRKDELLSVAARAEVFSNHPIALSIIKEYDQEIDSRDLHDYQEIPGYGIRVNDGVKTIIAGNAQLMKKEEIDFAEVESTGTKVYIAKQGRYLGCLIISDVIKEDSKDLIAFLKTRNIKTVMLTGDNDDIAQAVAIEIGIEEVYSELLPHQKVEKVEMLNKQKSNIGKLAFMGDGINDAPVLALADIGISMGGLGADAALEAADIVIMNDEPSRLIKALDIARFTRSIVWENIVFALLIKGVFLLLGAFGIATMWEAVFADVGVALLAILNALRIMKNIRFKKKKR